MPPIELPSGPLPFVVATIFAAGVLASLTLWALGWGQIRRWWSARRRWSEEQQLAADLYRIASAPLAETDWLAPDPPTWEWPDPDDPRFDPEAPGHAAALAAAMGPGAAIPTYGDPREISLRVVEDVRQMRAMLGEGAVRV